MKLCIRSERVLLTGPDGYRIVPATVEIEGAHIRRIDETSAAGASEQGPRADTVDLGGRLLTPAFVNPHTHLALAFMRGVGTKALQKNLVEDLYFAFESRLDAGDVRAFSRLGAYESLLHGVGFVWDHYYGGTAVADALCDTGLAGVVAPTVQDLSGPDASGSDAALAATLSIAENGLYSAQGVFAALGPHATDTVSPALLARIAALAEAHALPVHLHVAQSFDELRRVTAREGCSPLQVLERAGVLARAPHVMMAHALFLSRDDLRSLDAARHTLVLCPSSQAQFAMPAQLETWAELDVPWTIATDCASSNDSMNLQKELRACLLLAAASTTYSASYADFLAHGQLKDAEVVWRERMEKSRGLGAVLRPEALLSRVFERPGAAHPALRVGILSEGALANLVAWDIDHPAFFPAQDLLRVLALGDTSQAIHTMWVAGKPVGVPGDFARSLLDSDTYRSAHKEAAARMKRLGLD